jgi:sodium/hydrogen exchanger 8
VLLPPLIFEAGYSLNAKDFYENIGAITLYAMFGTIISTFVVGFSMFYAARLGLIANVDQENPMEALLFGALISAVDPVATLSIMGNADLRCDPLLYSLVFGESVLNDAIAISLFRVFAQFYDPTGPTFSQAQIPSALLSFVTVSILSIGVGVALGLVASYIYKHTELSLYPNLETSLLFCFCYLCYSTGESLGLSGIMALFFQGLVLSHYNSYNLSDTAHVASEQIFSTLATIAETVVFMYMGMGVFTGRFEDYDVTFSILALVFCLVGRLFNIFPLSWIANLCRTGRNRITGQMQCVLWFAGLRGAIAFALAMNMPGPNREVYATATLSICIFTTVVNGSLTERTLTVFGMKEMEPLEDMDGEESMQLNRLTFSPKENASNGHDRKSYPLARRARQHVYHGAKRLWKQLDDDVLKIYFGGDSNRSSGHDDHLGHYELGNPNDRDYSESSSDDT